MLRANDTLLYYLISGTYNLATDSIVYVVAGAHLDDQWQWTLHKTIQEALPATFAQNFNLLKKYPEYQFSFEGAYRYKLMKQYYPAQYDTMKQWIDKGRWHYVGTFWDPCDVNLPSAESLIRQALYGTEFSMAEFGKRSIDIYLPDCFGFGYALPTIATHCGITGFSTQKFDRWGGSFSTPFSIGRWVGVDGNSVIASLKPGNYIDGFQIRTQDGNDLKAKSGVWLTQDYVGTGDFGGAPAVSDLEPMISRMRQNGSNSIKVVCEAADKLFKDLTPAQVSRLPSYDGELLMSTHGTGCYTSWATMKLKNRRNEQRAAAEEFACVTANWMTSGTFNYPLDTISSGWKRFLACQFHDVLPGTSIVGAYAIAQPMEDSSYNDFNYAFNLGNTAIANSSSQSLNTSVTKASRVPIVLVNSLAYDRCDVVKCAVQLSNATHTGVKVYDQMGSEVPSQIIGTSGQTDTNIFLARVPSAGYAIYEAESALSTNQPAAGLSIKTSSDGDTLQNSFYRVVVNTQGDISSVYHKVTGKELLSSSSRLELRANNATSWPAWEVDYDAVAGMPSYVDQGVTRTIRENGPARVTLQITRTKNGSSFTQYIRLAADSAGLRVDVDNEVNWMTNSTLLKVGFPVTCSNPKATWDLGIGTIQRGNMTRNLYEVPGQQWADMTATDGTYGLSILNDCKYGWNKESDSKLNLTLIHSPSEGGYDYQNDLSNVNFVGIHKFTYSFYGHSGSFTSGTISQAASLNQPIHAFQAVSRTGTLNAKMISFVKTNSAQVDVMAIKKAQKSNYYVIRVRETHGLPMTGAKLTFGSNISQITEMNGVEEILKNGDPVTSSGKDLVFNLKKYQPRTFAITLSGSPQVGVNPRWRSFSNVHKTNILSLTVRIAGKFSKISFALQPGEVVHSVKITDTSGKTVKKLNFSGKKDLTWDGIEQNGARVGTGMYLISLKTNRAHMAERLIVSR